MLRHTLALVEQPDEIRQYLPQICRQCRQVLAVYLQQGQLLPMTRIYEALTALCVYHILLATVLQWSELCRQGG